MNQTVSILLILIGVSLNSFSQDFAKLDSVMIDSLRKNLKSELFIIQENISGGCTEAIGERNPRKIAKSCLVTNKFWIIWFDLNDGFVKQTINNECLEYTNYQEDTTNLNIKFNKLFNTVFLNNSIPNFIIGQEPSGANSSYPVPCSYFKISRLSSNNDYTIICNEFITEMDTSELNPDSIEYQTISLLYEFENRMIDLNRLGEKQKENWH